MKLHSTVPRCRWLRVLGLAVLATAASGQESWQAVLCDAARPYRGPALHPPPMLPKAEDVGRPLDGALSGDTIGRLESAMTRAMEATRAPAMSVAVGIPGRGLWTATRHRAPGGPSQSDGGSPRWFWAASVGKAFTAVVVLQLVGEGQLRLSDPLSRWFPDVPNAGAITVEHLLTHTSGIYSFQADPAFRARPGYQPPEDLIALAAAHGNGFCPGELWSYSNTGYVLLGRIVERIEGRPFHASVMARVVERLGLNNTRAIAPREEPEGLAAPQPSDPAEALRKPALSTPFAAGNVIASAEDLVRFWHGLLAGRLLDPSTVQAQYQQLYPMFGNGTYYGRGVMLYAVPEGGGRTQTWLGHSGGAPGVKALVAFAPERGAYVAVLLTGDGSAEATAHLLLRALVPAADGPGSQ